MHVTLRSVGLQVMNQLARNRLYMYTESRSAFCFPFVLWYYIFYETLRKKERMRDLSSQHRLCKQVFHSFSVLRICHRHYALLLLNFAIERLVLNVWVSCGAMQSFSIVPLRHLLIVLFAQLCAEHTTNGQAILPWAFLYGRYCTIFSFVRGRRRIDLLLKIK